MNYLSVSQTAEKWDMTPRRVQVLCNEGRIDGAQRVGNVWTIPETATKPSDARKKITAKTKGSIHPFQSREFGLCQTKIHLKLSLYTI